MNTPKDFCSLYLIILYYSASIISLKLEKNIEENLKEILDMQTIVAKKIFYIMIYWKYLIINVIN